MLKGSKVGQSQMDHRGLKILRMAKISFDTRLAANCLTVMHETHLQVLLDTVLSSYIDLFRMFIIKVKFNALKRTSV